jgi:magnesium-transporting ATPase (P-type)
MEVNVCDLVVGDHILLQTGDKIPVDGRLIAGELFINNAVLNGEYQSKRKTVAPLNYVAQDPHDFSDPHLLFRGSVVGLYLSIYLSLYSNNTSHIHNIILLLCFQ